MARASEHKRGDPIGYARISTDEQNLALQLDALQQADCRRVFQDVGSGSLKHRPELDACLQFLATGDTLVVWRLDRLGRELKHLIELVETLQTARNRVQVADRGDRHHQRRRALDLPHLRSARRVRPTCRARHVGRYAARAVMPSRTLAVGVLPAQWLVGVTALGIISAAESGAPAVRRGSDGRQGRGGVCVRAAA